MCFYRYCYYSSCRHGETVLVDFCHRARVVRPAKTAKKPDQISAHNGQYRGPDAGGKAQPEPSGGSGDGGQSSSGSRELDKGGAGRKFSKKKQKKKQQQRVQQREQSKIASSEPSCTPAACPQEVQQQQLQTPSSLIPAGISSASITDWPSLPRHDSSTSSLPVQQAWTKHSHTDSTSDMAGLRNFNFSSWLTGSSGQPWEAEKQTEHLHGQSQQAIPSASLRRKEPGIRATDESWDLPNSEDLLQHLTESSQRLGGSHRQHIGTSRAVSDGSDTYEAIESALDDLKSEVVQLKKQRDSQRASMASGIEDVAPPKEESPAERLLRLHKQLEAKEKQETPTKVREKSPPKASDFPELLPGKVSTQSPGSTGIWASTPSSESKVSYASMVSAGLKRADVKGKTDGRNKHTENKAEGGLMRSSTEKLNAPNKPRLSMDSEGADTTIIVSPQEDSQAIGSERPAPRFAQPTASFARRADETASRKDSLSAKPAEVSPSKSMRAKEPVFETEKRATQRLSKRKSIPNGWMTNAFSNKDSGPTASSPAMSINSPQSDNGEWHVLGKSTVKEAVAATKTQEVEEQKAPRKKTSSYMSPTAAATQRTIATIGKDSGKRKAGTLHINTALANQSAAQSPKTGSDSSVVSAIDTAFMQGRVAVNDGPLASPRRRIQQTTNTSPAQGSVVASPGRRNIGSKKPASSPSSPSKIPRARNVGRALPQAESTSLPPPMHSPADALGAVANTVARRRTSHADILKPIFDKLDSQGLLKGKSEASNASHDAKQEAKARDGGLIRRPIREEVPETPRNMSPALQDIAMMARQGVGIKGKALPPHMRSSRQSSVVSSNADVSSVNIITHAAPAEFAASQPSSCAVQPEVWAKPANDGAVFDSQLQRAVSHTSAENARPFAASSLRATAPDFKPIWQPRGPAQELGLLSWQGKLDRASVEAWSAMPPDVQHSIQRLRNYSSSPSKRQNMRFWGNLMTATGLPPPVPAPVEFRKPTMTNKAIPVMDGDGDVAMLDARVKVPTVSPNSVQIGQVLRPTLSPGKKNVKWTLQDVDGQEKPVTFGRCAGASSIGDDMITGDTPMISPNSDDTSPYKTPFHARAWTIGSGGYAPRASIYGWKGGDGKEIRFSGYGPHAERDPNTPVNMQYNQQPAHSVRGPGAVASPPSNLCRQPEGFNDGSPAQKVWPRSMKQWAELAGPRKLPCGSFEITQAAESIPLGQRMTGYCNSCTDGRH